MHMKKHLYPSLSLFTFLLILPFWALAQEPDGLMPQDATQKADFTRTKALQGMWDLQFTYDISEESMQYSLSNGTYTDSEFWISEWNSDTLLRFDHDGNFIEWFTIPTLSGVRGMSWDGAHIWMANNSSSLYQVDPLTKQIVGTIFLNIPEAARFVSWDPTADNGNGGFWTGNFNTDIFLVDLNGNMISSIPASTHGLSGMYGAAVDNQSPGGPYLWVFHQAGAPNDALISLLHLPEGSPTGVIRNVEFDLNTSGALAGGLFITDAWSNDGTLTLGGVLQGAPDLLFGYELSYVPGDPITVGAQTIITPLSGCELGEEETVEVSLSNNGPLEASDLQLSLYLNDSLVAEETYAGPLSAGQTVNYIFNAKLNLAQAATYRLAVFATTNGDINNSDDLASKTVASKKFAYPPISDDFDSYEQGMTEFPGLYNIGKVAFLTNAGMTPSSNTGPADDLSGGGNYIYMEASGYDPGDQAVLTTDCLDFSTVEDPQLIFYYHMYGSGVGYLSVDLTDENGQIHNLFLQEGQAQTSSQEEWIPVLIDLASWSGQVVEITFTGEIGSSGSAFRSDIALDAIQIPGCPLISPNADIVPPTSDQDGSITLNPSGATPPYTFSWNTGSTNAGITFSEGDDFSVTITDANGCSTTIDFTVVRATDLNGLEQFELSPNPAEGQTILLLKTTTSLPSRIELLDARGRALRQIYEGPLPSGNSRIEIDLSTLPAGLYFLCLSANEKTSTRRLIVR